MAIRKVCIGNLRHVKRRDRNKYLRYGRPEYLYRQSSTQRFNFYAKVLTVPSISMSNITQVSKIHNDFRLIYKLVMF